MLPNASTITCYYTVLACTGGFYTPRLTKREDTVSNMYFADLAAVRLHIDTTLAGTVGGKVCWGLTRLPTAAPAFARFWGAMLGWPPVMHHLALLLRRDLLKKPCKEFEFIPESSFYISQKLKKKKKKKRKWERKHHLRKRSEQCWGLPWLKPGEDSCQWWETIVLLNSLLLLRLASLLCLSQLSSGP